VGDTGRDLRLEGVTKHFGDFVAVDDLTLTVPQGSFFALLGPSGCGKTTTLRMVAGLEDPTRGRVLIGDEDITGLRPYKRPVNTVFQSYALFPHLSVFENVAFGRRSSSSSSSVATARASPRSSPAASSSGWRWPGR
jgi:spermidine/putrescine transport system ATP-binding protein